MKNGGSFQFAKCERSPEGKPWGIFNKMGVSENVVYPFLANGFADHYLYHMAISLGIYPIFRQTHV